ncbi:MAG: ABC transporter permease subunit [Candidatus Omnitrophica bacterium]|nr:ABC transporter permease subunit [Candidatus Omnitrophota bacterium]
MANSDAFEPVTETGWRMGFSNLMNKELKAWFGTSAWWQQALLWSGILGIISLATIQDPEAGLTIFYIMATIFPSIAVIIISQEKILEEKRSGSAAWVLSKPVSRTAFILAKLLPNAVSFSISMIMIPGIVVFLASALIGFAPDPLVFCASLVPLMLWQVFIMFLTICLGTFYDSEGAVMALPFVFTFTVANLGMDPTIGPYGPWGLFQLAISIGMSTTYPIYPLPITIAVLIALGAISVWRFSKHEF